MTLSRRVTQIPQALSIYMNQLVAALRARGAELIALSLGDTFFTVDWPSFDSLDMDRGSNYSDSRGIADLRAALCEFYSRQYGAKVDPSREILVTAGSKIAIYLAMQTILDPGDEVAIQEPAWLSYQEQVRLLDGVPRFFPYDVPASQFSEHFTPRTKIVLLNNPNNPAGKIYSAAELKAVYRQCRSHGIYLLVDEAYSDFVTGDRFQSLAALVPDKDGIIVVNSLSKSMGIAGWRIGYAIAAAPFLDQMLKLNQHLITCAPTILQQYVAKHFDGLMNATIPQAQELARERAAVGSIIDEMGIRRMGGEATFYFFLSIGDYEGDSVDFALSLLLEDGISVVPGVAYGASTDRFIRISLGAETRERLIAALQKIKSRIDRRTFDADALNRKMSEYGFARFDGA